MSKKLEPPSQVCRQCTHHKTPCASPILPGPSTSQLCLPHTDTQAALQEGRLQGATEERAVWTEVQEDTPRAMERHQTQNIPPLEFFCCLTQVLVSLETQVVTTCSPVQSKQQWYLSEFGEEGYSRRLYGRDTSPWVFSQLLSIHWQVRILLPSSLQCYRDYGDFCASKPVYGVLEMEPRASASQSINLLLVDWVSHLPMTV